MSYYNPPVSAARTRPGVVTAAGALLYAVAGLYALTIIVSLSTMSHQLEAVRNAGLQAETNAARAGAIGGIVVDVIVIALFVLLAIFVMRGNNGMRITTWVIGGLGVLCSICGAIGSGFSSSLLKSDGLDSDQTEVLQNAVPNWAMIVAVIIAILVAIALMTVIILLALPAANPYFKKDRFMVVPGYPAYPGYPAQDPGYPATPQASYPSYPSAGWPATPNQPNQPGYTDPSAPQSAPPQSAPPQSVPPQATAPQSAAPDSVWAPPADQAAGQVAPGAAPGEQPPAPGGFQDEQTRHDPNPQ